MWGTQKLYYQKVFSLWPMVVIKKKWWGCSESQEKGTGYFSLKHSCIYFSLSILGKTKLFHSEHKTSRPSISFLELPYLFDVWVALCCFEGWQIYSSAWPLTLLEPRAPLDLRAVDTRAVKRKSSSSLCFDTKEFCFPLVHCVHPLLKTNKHSSTGQYCACQPSAAFDPTLAQWKLVTFLTIGGWHSSIWKRILAIPEKGGGAEVLFWGRIWGISRRKK